MIPEYSHDATLRVVRSLNLSDRGIVDPFFDLLGKRTAEDGQVGTTSPVAITPGKKAGAKQPGVDDDASAIPLVGNPTAATPQ